jgi:hypothetical protein
VGYSTTEFLRLAKINCTFRVHSTDSISLPVCVLCEETVKIWTVKMAVFWDIAPCSLVEVDRRFRCAYCLHHQGDDRRSTYTTIHDTISQKAVRDRSDDGGSKDLKVW